MTYDDNLRAYGRKGRGAGVGIMLALLAVLVVGGMLWFGFGTSSSDLAMDEKLTPQRQTTGAGSRAAREDAVIVPPADRQTTFPATRQ